MQGASIDSDVIIRFLTGDDPKKQLTSARLLEKVENSEIILLCPDTVIADCVYVLSSSGLYHLPKQKTRDLLLTILRLTNFKMNNKETVIGALELFAQKNVDFGDAMVVIFAQKKKIAVVYSFDHDFDKFPEIKRLSPE